MIITLAPRIRKTFKFIYLIHETKQVTNYNLLNLINFEKKKKILLRKKKFMKRKIGKKKRERNVNKKKKHKKKKRFIKINRREKIIS